MENFSTDIHTVAINQVIPNFGEILTPVQGEAPSLDSIEPTLYFVSHKQNEQLFILQNLRLTNQTATFQDGDSNQDSAIHSPSYSDNDGK